ncbi:MAG: DNA-directed RNA polymerase subunit A' [Candidatus Woesearchaeota archaeon]
MAEEKISSQQPPLPSSNAEAGATQLSSSPDEKMKPVNYDEFLEPEEMGFVHKEVGSLVFAILSPKVIEEMSTVKVVTPELYDKEGYPVDGGLMDLRLGVIDPGLKCKTCGMKLKECTGHFGHIELARPVIHYKFVAYILKFLKGSCSACGRALLTPQKIGKAAKKIQELHAAKQFDLMRDYAKQLFAEMSTAQKCPHCNAKQTKITLEKPTTFMEDEKRITPIDIRSRLEKIPDDDCWLFGIDPASFRPEWAIITVLPIPSVTMRPSITLETGERSEDDLTHKLGDIVRINQRLFENINAGAPEIIVEDLWDLLQYHITTFFDNNISQLPPARHRSGQPLKTLTERIKSKEGRIRHNLAGKRTNFSARTVVSPDPNIKINEVGVPFSVAMRLTLPERVTKWNIAYLKQYVQRGPKQYPGANYVVRPDGKRKRITDQTKEQILEELQPGYAVERHIINGDIALFNRQPSLHRASMMAHKVRVLPGNTFRLNPAVCHPYNADFDGDEMNLHIPQTEEARAEAEFLLEVSNQLISPKFGLATIGLIQDAISGNYLLTKELSFTRREALDLLYSVGEVNPKLPRKEVVSGKEVFSALLPSDFDYKDDTMVISKGVLEQGVIDKSKLGGDTGMLLRSYHQKYGKDATLEFLWKVLKLGVEVLKRHGFTSAISDIDLPAEISQEIRSILDKAHEEVSALIQEYQSGKLEAYPGRTLRETLELRIITTLNKARNETGKIVQRNAKVGSHTLIMALSGARGNFLNLAQITACVGQQVLRGRRIEKGYQHRTLSCFKPHDLSPKAHGFIARGFREGLEPHEFFFMSMTARDSLMDTALRTPKSGYLYRRLANALQDVHVTADGTVRDSTNMIIQYTYGDDGIDVSKSEAGSINVKRIIKEILEAGE